MPMEPKKMVRYLQANGFKKIKGGGKGGHQKMFNPETNRTTEVPMHNGDLDKGTEHAILRQAGLK